MKTEIKRLAVTYSSEILSAYIGVKNSEEVK